jgi:hypothetical protein
VGAMIKNSKAPEWGDTSMKRKNKNKTEKEAELQTAQGKQPQRLSQFFAQSPLAKANPDLERSHT